MFTMCYYSSIRWLQNWGSFSLPHMCLLGDILCNACKKIILFSSKLKIFRKDAQCHRRINFLQPFTWALPDFPFTFCEKQEFGNLSKTGSMTLRSMSNKNPFRIHEFQQKATLRNTHSEKPCPHESRSFNWDQISHLPFKSMHAETHGNLVSERRMARQSW